MKPVGCSASRISFSRSAACICAASSSLTCPALGIELLERLALVPGRPQDADRAAYDEETGQNPCQSGEAGGRERRNEEAEYAERDPHDREAEALGRAAQHRREHLRAPQLEKTLRAEAAAELQQEYVEQRDGDGQREQREQHHARYLDHRREREHRSLAHFVGEPHEYEPDRRHADRETERLNRDAL